MVKKFYVWIEPIQNMIAVSADTYLKLVDLKIWANPEELVSLTPKRRPLHVREIDPFPDLDKYFVYVEKLLKN